MRAFYLRRGNKRPTNGRAVTDPRVAGARGGGDMRVELIPMNEYEFQIYEARETARYAEANVRAGYWSPAEALDKARQAHRRLLPQGMATPGHHFFAIVAADIQGPVGAIWMAEERSTSVPSGFIYDLFVEEPWRGRGLAGQAMLALEERARQLGLATLYLHVFADNPVARALYDKLGYRVTSLNMAKPLSPG